MAPPLIRAESRKARRKQERQARKRKKSIVVNSEAPIAKEKWRGEESAEKRPKKKTRLNNKEKGGKLPRDDDDDDDRDDPYAHLDAETAAAMRRDDAEIDELKSRLGITGDKEKSRLYREYAKLEGYGDDFGDFLDDLDGMVHRVMNTKDEAASEREHSSKNEFLEKGKNATVDPYAHLDADTAAAMRRDDAEIADLEVKLGLHGKKERKRLHREYSKLEGYDDDFGEFLDDLDNIVRRVVQPETAPTVHNEDDSSLEIEDEEIVPAKEASQQANEIQNSADEVGHENFASSEEDSSDEGSESDGDVSVDEPDHDIRDTYRPSRGEDIYGNEIVQPGSDVPPTKYVPPHIRNKLHTDADEDESRAEVLRQLQRALNNSLNRLSEDTLISVAQSLTKLYPSYPTPDVNRCLWENVMNACVKRPTVISSMIPVYTACLAGVHLQTGDNVQLGGFLLEEVITVLWKELDTIRCTEDNEDVYAQAADKGASNLVLLLSYLYNFGVAHCSLMYDVVRNLIEHFTEIDIELLLLILSHCGHALRADDASALKEIVLSVQKKSLEGQQSRTALSSRVDYMITAMIDLKNNKKRRQDQAFGDKTAKLRKLLGRIKSTAATNGTGRSSDVCLRITLKDIIKAEEQGRWWKIGARFVGNQYAYKGDDAEESDEPTISSTEHQGKSVHVSTEEEEILKLASTQRMNSDTRRSIFCIIMGSEDCDDAFEKLVRAGMLKNRAERDTVRVLTECCGNEKTFNPFYAHLAARICDYQPQCKFTFQLTFWDTFKQFDKLKPRKAANLAKLLFHLVAVHRSLRLNVLKVIDMSPDTMSDQASIFLTIFFSSIFDSFESPRDVVQLFPRSRPDVAMGSASFSENSEDGSEALREGLSVFFLQTLKSSPKNQKGSKFRANLKAALKACETDTI